MRRQVIDFVSYVTLLTWLYLQPDDGLRPEDKERTRCAVGTARQVGSAFYFVSSYVRISYIACRQFVQVCCSASTTAIRALAPCSPTLPRSASPLRATLQVARRSLSPTSTLRRTQTSLLWTPAVAVAWSSLADGASPAPASVAKLKPPWKARKSRRLKMKARSSLLSRGRKRRIRRPSRLPSTNRHFRLLLPDTYAVLFAVLHSSYIVYPWSQLAMLTSNCTVLILRRKAKYCSGIARAGDDQCS